MNTSMNTSTPDFNDTTMNTTVRESNQADVEDRASILESMDKNPIVIAIS